ncbi:MAG TPA: hypothetical protein VJ570_06050 [Holophagaceae bacterium]|nr:hypothetical protein [Holophagaceae bacterium]
MTHLQTLRLALSLALLGLLQACTGGSSSESPAAPSGFAYKNPTSAGWRLVQAPSSSPKRLVLNLVGPTGEKGRGVGLNLRSDGAVKFGRFPNGTYVNHLGVFQLGNLTGPLDITGSPAAKDVVALLGGVKEDGRLLSVGCFQKDRRQSAQDLGRPLLQIALDWDPAAEYQMGQTIALALVRARSIPEYIGDNPDAADFNPYSVIQNYRIDEINVEVGKVTIR